MLRPSTPASTAGNAPGPSAKPFDGQRRGNDTAAGGLASENRNPIAPPANGNAIPRPTNGTEGAQAAMKPRASAAAASSGASDTSPPLTPSQAGQIVADGLAQVASGAIEPAEGDGFDRIGSDDAAEAADTIGRLLARDGAQADLTQPLGIIAAAREDLASFVSEQDVAAFDAAVADLANQRFLIATGDPAADPAALSAARDSLQTESFIPTSTDDAFTNASLAINSIVRGGVPIDETVDLSGASPQQLGSAAADAADRIGRLAGEFRQNDTFEATQTDLATIRAQVQANGANPVQISEFDNAIATIARQRAFDVTGSDAFDPDALRAARDSLKSGELGALGDPGGDFEAGLATRADQLVAGAVGIERDPALTAEIATLDTGQILSDLDGVTGAFAGDLSGSLAFNRPEGDPVVDAQKRYAAIRDQLAADGASAEQLAALDDVVSSSSLQQARSRLGIDLNDAEQGLVNLFLSASLSVTAGNTLQPDAIRRTNLVRSGRLEGDASILSGADLGRVQRATNDALAHGTEQPFAGGTIRLASQVELAGLLTAAADLTAQGLATNNETILQDGFDLFDQARDEVVRRAPGNALPSGIVDAFEDTVRDALAVLRNPGPEANARVEASRAALLDTFMDVTVEAPFGIASQASFEGDNGAAPARIFAIELKPGQGTDPSANFGGHDVAVTNVIESQLQAAGQSYELTNIQAGAGQFTGILRDEIGSAGYAPAAALRSVIDMVEESGGPAFVNLSLSRELTPRNIATALFLLKDTDLVSDDLADVAISPENFDLFADTVRSIGLAALDPDRQDVRDLLGPETSRWEVVGATVQALEEAAAAGIDVFVGTPNSSSRYSAFQFAQDEGAPGSITRVGATSPESVFESDAFILPGQGEGFPQSDTAPDGIAPSDPAQIFYRGGGVDVYASGVAVAGLDERRVLGSSFATPEMLVNAVLGRFDPNSETRT